MTAARLPRPSRPGIEFAGRLDALDGLRTVAVLLVFVAHAATALMRGGSVGVDVFFVISGFVITLLIVRELEVAGGFRFGRFYLNRLARLWPALLLLAAVVATVSVVSSADRGGEVGPAAESAGYLFDFERAFHWIHASTGSAFGHTWSLAVEEQFYLVWPLLLIVLVRLWGIGGAAVATFVVAVLPTGLRFLLWDGGAGLDRIYNMPDTRADQLLVGCGLALTLTALRGRADRLRRFLHAAIWPAIILILVYAVLVPEPVLNGVAGLLVWTVGVAVIAVIAGCLVGGLATSRTHPLSRLLASRWMAWPGRHLSYGFYLWHYPLVLAALTLHVPAAARVLLALGGGVVLAFMSSRFVEEPVRRRVRAAADRRASVPA